MTRSVTVTTDGELADRFQNGDQQALETLVDRYRRFARAKGRSYFLVGGDRDDIEQEALIGLYKAARDFRAEHEASFRAFAELCITRQIITAIKTATRHKHQPLNQYLSMSSSRSSDDDDDRSLEELLEIDTLGGPEDQVLAAERIAALQAMMIDRLSGLELAVLDLYVQGTSYVDMGERLGRHTKSIDNALQRIKCKLGDHLALDGDADDAPAARADASTGAEALALAS